MVHVPRLVEVALKSEQENVTIQPPPMAVRNVQDQTDMLRHVLHGDVQLMVNGHHGEVSDYAMSNVEEDTKNDIDRVPPHHPDTEGVIVLAIRNISYTATINLAKLMANGDHGVHTEIAPLTATAEKRRDTGIVTVHPRHMVVKSV